MSVDGGLTWDEPATALALVARGLEKIAPRADLQERFAGQGDPGSLLALVQVAGQLGLEARAVRGDLARLRQIALPAVLHLQNPLDEADQGFAVLAEREPGLFVLATGDGRRSVLQPEELEHLFTGVMVTFGTHPGVQPPPLPPWRSPVAGGAAEAVDGDPARTARGLIALALPLAGAVAALRTVFDGGGSLPGLVRLAWVAAASLGAWMSWQACTRSRSARSAGPGCVAQRPCGGGAGFDCDGLLASRWGAPFAPEPGGAGTRLGLDLGTLGLSFFIGALVLLAAGAALPPPARRSADTVLATAFLLATPLSLLLLGLQVRLRRYCTLCLGAHAGTLAGAGAGSLLAWPPALPPAAHLPALIAAYLITLLVVVAFVAPAPALRQAVGESRTRLGFAGSTPLGALAETIARPPARALPAESPFTAGDRNTPVRIDALIDPRCPACAYVLDELFRLVENHPRDLHLVVHLPTRDTRDPTNRPLRVALTAAGTLAAYHAARDRPDQLRALLAGGPQAVLPALGAGDRPLAPARTAQAAADALAAELGNVTPTLLVSGKLWPRPVWELDLLLTCHPEALAPLRRPASPEDRIPHATSSRTDR
jgi:hypothetical protein